jgi:hypothetical protein
MSLVEHELLTLSEYLSAPPVVSGVRFTRFTDFDYSIGILKLFLSLTVTGINILNYKSLKQEHCKRRVWRYQRGNQNPYIEEEQTTQWPKEKVQKDKQRSRKSKNIQHNDKKKKDKRSNNCYVWLFSFFTCLIN